MYKIDNCGPVIPVDSFSALSCRKSRVSIQGINSVNWPSLWKEEYVSRDYETAAKEQTTIPEEKIWKIMTDCALFLTASEDKWDFLLFASFPIAGVGLEKLFDMVCF